MKKVKNYIYTLCASLALVSGLSGCREQEMVKPYALLAESSLTFGAKDAEPQVLTIASDESWLVDVDSDWISIDPTSGKNTVYANVSVLDNVDANGKLAAPRKGKITITTTRGEYSVETVIYQNGDTYLEASEYSVSELIALQNSENEPQIPAKVKESTVMAVSAEGFVISDGTSNIVVSGEREVAVGNKVTLNGSKAVANGLPVFIVDEVLSNDKATEVTYPQATDITATLDAFTSDKTVLVTVAGTLVDNTLMNIGSASKNVNVLADASLELDKVNVHKLTITGYYAGVIGGAPSIVATSFKDNGEDENIGAAFPYNDDFSWLDKFVELANSQLADKNKINDSVGEQTSSADGAANVYSTLEKSGLIEELRSRGYKDLNPDFKTIYLQQGYLKYGANNKQSGLTLPLLKIDGEQDIVVTFRYCAHMGGSGGVDKVKLAVAISGPGTVVTTAGDSDAKISDPIAHTQETGKMFWQDASVTITGATRATSITIRNFDEQFGSAADPVSGYFRYYLDDISVFSAADAVESEITVSGLENNLITFDGTPAGTVSFDVTAEKDYKIYTNAKWFSVDETSGAGGETKTVTVTCETSDLSTLRKGVITIKSGTSSHDINVVQSAAGQSLDPFVSISSGNSVDVLGEGEDFSARVQSNVEYKVVIDEDWIEQVPTPDTKALVEWKEYTFKAKVNVTGAARTGHIHFIAEGQNIESVLVVNQDNFEARVDVAPATAPAAMGIAGYGATVNYVLDANIPYTVSTTDSWITLPANQGPASTITVPVVFAANPSSDARTGSITITNPSYQFTKTVSIVQYPSGVWFKDDFSWLRPLIEEYNTLNPSSHVGNPMNHTSDDWANANNAVAPNVYKDAPFVTKFAGALASVGYEDMNPGGQVIYAQDCHLKLGKTSVHTSLKLPALAISGTKDFTVEFDWFAHIQGSGKVDPVQLVLHINGNGQFENGTKYSDPLASSQAAKEYKWNHVSVKVKGADKDTRINIVWKDVVNQETGAYNWTVKTAERWHIDNILIK